MTAKSSAMKKKLKKYSVVQILIILSQLLNQCVGSMNFVKLSKFISVFIVHVYFIVCIVDK